MVRILIKQKTKVGPKGQIVIPKSIRDGERLYPGTEVFVEWTDEGIKIEPMTHEDPIAVFERIAKSVKKRDVNSKHSYEEQLVRRWKRAQGSM